jgi:hypothetical protein
MLVPGGRDQFEFNFPSSFIPPEIRRKYSKVINRVPTGIDDAREYVNHSIQKITFPSISYTPAVQNQRTVDVGFRSSVSVQNLFEKEFTVTMQLTDGDINYLIMLETLFFHYSFGNHNLHIDPFRLYLTDSSGLRLSTIVLEQVLYTGLDALDKDFRENTREFISFDAKFTFNKIRIDTLGTTDDDIRNSFI